MNGTIALWSEYDNSGAATEEVKHSYNVDQEIISKICLTIKEFLVFAAILAALTL